MAYDDKRCCKRMEADFYISFSPSKVADLEDADEWLRKDEAEELYASKAALDDLQQEIEEEVNVKIENIETALEDKQDKLIPGEGITIDEETNTISATVSNLDWGNIQGEISNQADLMLELSKKENILDLTEDVEEIVRPMIEDLQTTFDTSDGLYLDEDANELSLIVDGTLKFKEPKVHGKKKLGVDPDYVEGVVDDKTATMADDIANTITPTITNAVTQNVNNNLVNNILPAFKQELSAELVTEITGIINTTIIPALKTELEEYIDEAVEEAMAEHIQDIVEQVVEEKVPPMIEAALAAWSVNYYDKTAVDNLIDLADSDDTTYYPISD